MSSSALGNGQRLPRRLMPSVFSHRAAADADNIGGSPRAPFTVSPQPWAVFFEVMA